MASPGLFNRLLDLHARYPGRIPEEDFFTELAAYLFETSPMILTSWLESLGWQKPADYQDIRVNTQAEYDPLPGHVSGSRPDIRIELCAEGLRDLIFIESKMGAGEGDHQLQRYAEILHGDRSANQRWLMYITRERDTKDPDWIFQNIPGSPVVFRQLRWRDFYGFLIEQAPDSDKPQDFLVSEITRFMEENGMGKQVQFSEADLPALANLQHPFQLMLGVLDKDMQRDYQAVVGNRGTFTPIEYLTRDWARFGLEGEIVEGGLWCRLGFDNLAQGGNPRLFITLQVKPEQEYRTNRTLRKQLIEMMKDILVKRTDWGGWDLENPREYSGIEKSCYLRSLLPSGEIEEDCKAVLHGYLDELVEIKRIYPDILWKSTNG
jgi:hypothetical protein